MRIRRDERRRDELIAELRTARLVPGCVVSGIEHRKAATIVRTGLPTVDYRRRTLHRHLDEDLFMDLAADAAVRVRRTRRHLLEMRTERAIPSMVDGA
ncbi:hypothetical protein QRX50_14375 [Amycolatopsis carbonis]|uniref:Uncharacterized protein n=1 Tax=Amycolatopsis carbonis TaxID=715471 RepID=A0A9Y2N0D0_9PSEU|nr:hypothetical protein [Amycolatopsis sp. 2-15]WIX81852.1 hypothetical protein QRX50_14375 [Amycolatopsis sp. 2-15]